MENVPKGSLHIEKKRCLIIIRKHRIVIGQMGKFSSIQLLSHIQFLQPQLLQHARLPCPSPTPKARWCHPTISSSVIPFSSCLQSFPASGSFPRSQFVASGGQSIEVSASASVPPMNIQDWFPLGLTGVISLQSKGLSRVFSNTTVQKHQFFSAQFFYSPTLTSILKLSR